jgi:hypothetical protein
VILVTGALDGVGDTAPVGRGWAMKTIIDYIIRSFALAVVPAYIIDEQH